jgi:hypothetical protein
LTSMTCLTESFWDGDGIVIEGANAAGAQSDVRHFPVMAPATSIISPT